MDAQPWEACPQWTLADTPTGPCRGRGCPWGGDGAPGGPACQCSSPGDSVRPPRFSLRRKLFPPVPQVKTELGGSLTPGLQVSTARPCPPPLGFRNQIGRPRGHRGCSARGRGPLCPPGPRASSPQEGTRAGSRGKGTGPRRSAALCAATPRPGVKGSTQGHVGCSRCCAATSSAWSQQVLVTAGGGMSPGAVTPAPSPWWP